MNYQYSKTHCHFCQSPLVVNPFDMGELKCLDCPQSNTSVRYFITIDMLNITIEKYNFDFWFYDGSMVITKHLRLEEIIDNEQRFELPEHLLITTENYLDIIAKAEKLQTFR